MRHGLCCCILLLQGCSMSGTKDTPNRFQPIPPNEGLALDSQTGQLCRTWDWCPRPRHRFQIQVRDEGHKQRPVNLHPSAIPCTKERPTENRPPKFKLTHCRTTERRYLGACFNSAELFMAGASRTQKTAKTEQNRAFRKPTHQHNRRTLPPASSTRERVSGPRARV